MKQHNSTKPFFTFLRLTIFLTALHSGISSNAQFVQVNNTCGFSCNNVAYKPLVCNYGIMFMQDNTGAWYISPEPYSQNWNYTCNCFIFDPNPNNPINGSINVNLAKTKLTNDLIRIKNLGFTEIRLSGADYKIDQAGNPSYPSGISSSTYYTLMSNFFAQMPVGLKVIYVLGGLSGDYDYANNTAFKNFISTTSAQFANTTAIMAYDLCNEPSNALWATSVNDKYNFTKMMTEWTNCIRANDHNHLVTIGLFGPSDLPFFDPTLLPIDFVSMHFYPQYSQPTANQMMDALYYWCGKTMTIPWIIGETSYSATDLPYPGEPSPGTEADQLSYAQHTLARSVDCNCKGYSWWKYQQTSWGIATEDYMGLFYPYFGSSDGGPKLLANSSNNVFAAYTGLTQNATNCGMPPNYYSIFNANWNYCTGHVYDANGAPLANAVVIGKDATTYANYMTFTDGYGYYSLGGGKFSALASITVSLPGYSTVITTNPIRYNTFNFNLTKVNSNSWVKEWGNSDATGTLSNNWSLTSFDKFYKGDFNGDGRQDVLCIKYSGTNVMNDRMVILTYNNSFSIVNPKPAWGITAGWTLLWDNQSNSANGGGIYPYRNNLVIGDFDGNGTDDVLSVGGWTTWFTFVPNANPTLATWTWQDSNYGTVNNPSYPMSFMAPYTSSVITGDFYAIGRSSVIGVCPSNGWVTSFQLNGGIWSWGQSNSGQTNNPNPGYGISYLTPYKAQLVAGDLDGDGQVEVLGNALPNGAMALFKPVWNSSQAQWVWTQKWIDNANTSGLWAYRNNLQVGNFDADNNAEILGINAAFCVAFDFTSSYNLVWDGGYYPSISDWNISPSANQYLFVKTDVRSAQQMLLAIRGNDAGLYAFRPNIQTVIPCATIRMANQEEPVISNVMQQGTGGIAVYPNPNSGNFFIELSGEFDRELLKISVVDAEGRELADVKWSGSADDKLNVDLGKAAAGIYFLKAADGHSFGFSKIVVY
jgi:hypothetical protein